MKMFLTFFLSSCLYALQTAYVSFDHPEGWKCELSQGVWICQSTQEPDRKESVVLSIATVQTEWDSLDNFENYLKQTRTIQNETGEPVTSKISYVRKRNIHGHQWVDSLQFNSEVPGFWARYLATTHNKLAILITYIVSDSHYKNLAPIFERMVSSLKPNADFDINVASKQGDGPLPGATKLGPLQKNILEERLNIPKKKVQEEPISLTKIILLLIVIGLFIIYLRKRKQLNDNSKQ